MFCPLFSSDKDLMIDKYHIEYFERYAIGNKPYYSAGQVCAAKKLCVCVCVCMCVCVCARVRV